MKCEKYPEGVNIVFSEKSDGNMAYYAGKGTENTWKKRKLFFEACNVDMSQSVFLKQIHSDHVVVIQSNDVGKGSQNHESACVDADAMVTNIENVVLCIQVADCVPVLLFDRKNGAIGAIHSGWRGTLKNIVGKTVRHMKHIYKTKASDMYAWVGPSLRGCCFFVDEKISQPVRESGFLGLSRDGLQWHIAEACRGQLIQSGVTENHIVFSDECTSCGALKYFSYRREGGCAGRMIAGIWKTKEEKR